MAGMLAQLSRDELGLALEATDAWVARLVCRDFCGACDLGLVVGLELATVLPCADPRLAGRVLARGFAHETTRSRAVACRAALGFLALVRLCCRHGGVVAGSAALFIERACIARTDDDPAWLPNDVDCFLDAPHDARRLLDELVARPGQSRAVTVDRAGVRSEERYDGRLPLWSTVGEAVPRLLGDSVTYGLTVGRTALQLIVQKVVPAYPELNVAPCDCHRTPATGCRACMHVATNLREAYAAVWPARAPHTRFDLDGVCVAIRRVAGTDALEIDRLCGGGPLMTLRPQAVWSVDQHGVPRLHPPDVIERIVRRVGKYATRGFDRVVVPREFHLRLDPPVVLAVPQSVLECLREYMSFASHFRSDQLN